MGGEKDIGYRKVTSWRRWKGSWSWSFLTFISLSFWKSSWHGSTYKDEGVCEISMIGFWRNNQGLDGVGIVGIKLHEG